MKGLTAEIEGKWTDYECAVYFGALPGIEEEPMMVEEDVPEEEDEELDEPGEPEEGEEWDPPLLPE